MRVLYISPFAELGGAERCLLDMLASLGDVAPEVERKLLLLAEGPLAAAARALGVEVRTLPLPAELAALGESGSKSAFAQAAYGLGLGARALGYVRAFGRQIEELRADIVHSNGMKAHLLTLAAARRRSKVVLHLHDFPGQRRLSRHLLRALCSSAVTVIANSRAVADDCRRVLPRARVALLYNAIDTAYFSPGPGEPGWLAQLAGSEPPPPGTTSFALVATYARWKGQDLFLRAAARARRLEPTLKARWYVVGQPIYRTNSEQFDRDELCALAAELGIRQHVGFVPFVSDVVRVFRAADVVVHASNEREAFGRTIVEGMACRRPVIACRAGGAGELFEDGVTALGFRAGDVEALAAAMVAVAADSALAERLADAGRKHVLEGFDRKRLGPELLALYQNTLAGGGP